MTDYEARAGLWHAVALCLVAGFVDAIGYFELGQVFTANMTGNTVLLGASLVRGDWIALSYAATIGAFALGAAATSLLKLARVPLPALFFIAGALVVVIALADPATFVALCALSFVMGLQGGAINSFSGIRLPTVVVTSTLVNLMDALVRRSFTQSQTPAPPPAQFYHLAAAWLAYGAGGGAAVLAQGALAMPLLVPALLYGIVALGLYRRKG